MPSQTLRGNLAEWVRAGAIGPDATLVSLMKGIELGTGKRMSEVIAEVADVDPGRVAVVTGPNLAGEIAFRPADRRGRRLHRRGAGHRGAAGHRHAVLPAVHQ